MSHHELAQGLTDDYYTPKYVFDALDCGRFSMDVAAAEDPKKAFVDADIYISRNGIETSWAGFIWCNPPYGVRGSKMAWVDRIINQGNGLMLMPDRTSADWWQAAAKRCADILTTYKKIAFVSPDGTVNKSPSTGNTIFAFGNQALQAVRNGQANDLGMTHRGIPSIVIVGVSPTWARVVEIAINNLGGQGAMQEIYDAVERLAPDKVQGNFNWKPKVRQQLQEYCIRIAKGVYSKN